MGRKSRESLDTGAAARFDVVHARMLRFFPELVEELGGNPRLLTRDVGIDLDDIAAGDVRATYRQVIALFELAAERLHCPDFGMRLARMQGGGAMFGPLGQVMKNSRTFGEALEYVSGHAYAHSLAARIWLWRSPSGRRMFVGHDILLDRIASRAQLMEQMLLVGHLAALDMTGGLARARRIHFRHQPLSPLKAYRRYFGCEVRFGQSEDGIVFFARDLACPIRDPDARAYDAATAFIDATFTRHRPPLHAQVRGVIMLRLGSGPCTNDLVAARLNLHPRTLHRRLGEEGTSFQKIKDEFRQDLLLYYLQQTNLDLTRISEKLGFAEQSVFTRSCNRWFGLSPTLLRGRGRAPPDQRSDR